MKLILSGDIHIGRSSSRLPQSSASPDTWRAAGGWDRLVDLALARQADAVLLSGDITDQDNQFWEAIGVMERGIAKLAQGGISTLAVAGNHDHALLGRLADLLPADHFTLLGRHGQWERHTLYDQQGRPALHIDGWSFPSMDVSRSPLTDYALPADPALPILGMVHGDLDVPDSRYGPLSLARLQALPPQGWLLGHIHAPRFIAGPPWVLYPGSPQALDPGETGSHGPWEVVVEHGRLGEPVQHPSSTVWYDSGEVDLTDITQADAAQRAIIAELRARAAAIVKQGGASLRHIRLRVRLTGRTPLAARIASLTQDIGQMQLQQGQVEVTVESLDAQVLPAIDLPAHAQTSTAPGAVARLLLGLDDPQPAQEVVDLIQATQRRLDELARQGVYAQLPAEPVSEAQAREHLRRQAGQMLSHLLATSEGAT